MPYRKTPPLDARLQCRLTMAEKADVVEQAGVAGMTLSEYFRTRVLGRPVIADTDMAMIRELRRLGGLLKHLYSESGGVNRKKTADLLDEISGAIDRLGRPRQP